MNDRGIDEAKWRALSAGWNERLLLDFMVTVGAQVPTAG